ncbi:MAG: thymidine phosphorylase, partial [Vulcanimicrobiaceae bacterium]
SDVAALGEAVGPERPLALCHAREERSAALAAARLRRAYTLGPQPLPAAPVVQERLASPPD